MGNDSFIPQAGEIRTPLKLSTSILALCLPYRVQQAEYRHNYWTFESLSVACRGSNCDPPLKLLTSILTVFLTNRVQQTEHRHNYWTFESLSLACRGSTCFFLFALSCPASGVPSPLLDICVEVVCVVAALWV